MRFFLGTHQCDWLTKTEVPLFISAHRLRRLKRLPRAVGPWSLDSGGFTEISSHGSYRTSARDYVREVRLWSSEIGNMQWAAVQDWMCEPFITQKTGLTVAEHQRRTTHSYLQLKAMAPEISWVPVLQGWEPSDYLEHVDEYNRALPFPIEQFPLVGVGSICRRQATGGIGELVRSLWGMGMKLHGFGLKIRGLVKMARYLESADSLAWSFRARRGKIRMEGCDHATCTNCIRWALHWRQRLLGMLRKDVRVVQLQLFA